jgi:Tfp pilus assembly protein PilF
MPRARFGQDGTIIGILSIPFLLKRKKVYYGIAGAGVIFLIVSGILVVSNKLPLALYQKVPILARVRSISLKNNSRLMSWQQGLRAWASPRALFGYGPENYYIGHNRHFDTTVSQLHQGSAILDFDKAHNQPLENLVDLGIIGFLAYLLVFAAMGAGLIKNLREETKTWLDKLTMSLLFLLFTAYFIHLLFTFDTPNSYWLFFISLGLVYYVSNVGWEYPDPRPQGRIEGLNGQESDTSVQPREITGAIIITVMIIITPMMIYFINWKSYQASHKTAIAKAAQDKPIKTSFNFYYQALQYKPVQAFEIRKMMGQDALAKINEYQSEQKNILLYMAGELEKNTKNDYYSQLMLGMIYNLLGTESKEYYNIALNKLNQAKKLAPSRYQIYTESYGAYLGLGKFNKAKESVEKALSLGFKPKTAPQFTALGFVFSQAGELEKSLAYYKQALEIDPKNIQILGSIAALYKEMGEGEKARTVAEQMLEIEPELKKEVVEFLDGL